MLRITTETSALGVFRKISKKWSTATFCHFLTMFSGLKSKNFLHFGQERQAEKLRKRPFLHRQVEAEKLRKRPLMLRLISEQLNILNWIISSSQYIHVYCRAPLFVWYKKYVLRWSWSGVSPSSKNPKFFRHDQTRMGQWVLFPLRFERKLLCKWRIHHQYFLACAPRPLSYFYVILCGELYDDLYTCSEEKKRLDPWDSCQYILGWLQQTVSGTFRKLKFNCNSIPVASTSAECLFSESTRQCGFSNTTEIEESHNFSYMRATLRVNWRGVRLCMCTFLTVRRLCTV